ncbi:GNAT family N-acetyltransferase [Shewanella sp. NIFS-20-20]|uniref:GNAT family N-acetyltransferase n=1 Tax=Shewanella sp. NIFS-20-20 TaxID=2853806 RepID=UPI001C482E80|nr:GNAT family N-acetyltransferase [Shewanella sp. NIFS-20-20]MBV7314138.1 GNAT family N-acetyltransferase [Shewanella sp. NIFS-20-20]
MLIRKARAEDGLACFALRNAAILTGCKGFYEDELLELWTEGECPSWFLHVVATEFYVLEIAGRILATGFIDLNLAKLEALFVHPEVMRTGVGKAMYLYLESLAISHGLKEIRLESTINAAPFYRSLGFGGSGLERNSVYHSPKGFNLPCIEMHKPLGDARLTERSAVIAINSS